MDLGSMDRECAQWAVRLELLRRREHKCVSVTGSHISNVRYAVSLFANQLLFSNNQIDHFGDDGIDYGASNLAITKNNIHDNLDVGDGNHEDAMQGAVGVVAPGVALQPLSERPDRQQFGRPAD